MSELKFKATVLDAINIEWAGGSQNLICAIRAQIVKGFGDVPKGCPSMPKFEFYVPASLKDKYPRGSHLTLEVTIDAPPQKPIDPKAKERVKSLNTNYTAAKERLLRQEKQVKGIQKRFDQLNAVVVKGKGRISALPANEQEEYNAISNQLQYLKLEKGKIVKQIYKLRKELTEILGDKFTDAKAVDPKPKAGGETLEAKEAREEREKKEKKEADAKAKKEAAEKPEADKKKADKKKPE